MDNHRATRTPSSVRRNCDFCVKKKVKCPGDQDGQGCLICQKKGLRCNYSVKRKPGPKCRQREVQDLGPATEATEAPKDTSAPQRQQQHLLATGMVESGFDAGDGYGYAGGVGGEGGSPLMASSAPLTPPLRPFKKPRTMHNEDYSSARQQAERENKRKNVPLQSKPAPLTRWLWGSGEDDSCPTSVHSGGGAPLTPLFHGLPPTSCPLAAHRAPGHDPLGGAPLDSSAGTFGTQRAFSGGAQLLKTVIEPVGNLDGVGGGRADFVHSEDLSDNGGSFVFGLEGEELNIEELLGMQNPLDSLIDEVSGGSDASSNSSGADSHETARTGAFLRNQESVAGGRSEFMPEMGVDQRVGSRQSESLSGGALSGGGVGSGRGVRNDYSLDDSGVFFTFGESLLPELRSGDGEGFRGGAVDGSHLKHPHPTAAFPLAGDAPGDSAGERRAMSEHASTEVAINSSRGSSAHQLDGGGSEGHSSPFDPFAQDISQGQLSLGD